MAPMTQHPTQAKTPVKPGSNHAQQPEKADAQRTDGPAAPVLFRDLASI